MLRLQKVEIKQMALKSYFNNKIFFFNARAPKGLKDWGKPQNNSAGNARDLILFQLLTIDSGRYYLFQALA